MPSRHLGPLIGALPAREPLAVVRDGHRVIVAAGPRSVVTASGREAFGVLDGLPPGWWAGVLAYDLGRAVERVPSRARPALDVPDVVLVAFEARAVLDPRDGSVRVIGNGEGRRLLERALDRAGATTLPAPAPSRTPTPAPGAPAPATQWTSSLDRDAYRTGVCRIVEHIREGDCYQVNLTRRLWAPALVDSGALFATLEAANPAPYAALLRLPGVEVVSASPERFLRVDGDIVETRPIKGTAVHAEPLHASAKDRAENVMIVDLARNDLGRVCQPASITVPALCAMEAHPGLHHLVSTVRGRRRAGVGLGRLVHATFPPASVTGAPKPRALEIIETLEPVRRGVYCGALGWIDTERDHADLAVAIRTFVLTEQGTSLGTGAGITADSDPDGEWDETALKAARLLAAFGAARTETARGPAGMPA